MESYFGFPEVNSTGRTKRTRQNLAAADELVGDNGADESLHFAGTEDLLELVLLQEQKLKKGWWRRMDDVAAKLAQMPSRFQVSHGD